MLYLGSLKKDTDVWALPSKLEYLPHRRALADERVVVLFEAHEAHTPRPGAKPDWLFVFPLDGDGLTGWVEARHIKRDPLLIVDCYWGDHGPLPKFDRVVAEPGYVGAIIKATQGTKYSHVDWFLKNWKRVRDAGGDRYGTTWFRANYHYGVIRADAAKQARYNLVTVKKAGGWAKGDFLPIIDVEKGKENVGCSKQQVIDWTTTYAATIREETGWGTILYAGSFLAELGITDHMGCEGLWTARYGPELGDKPAKIGWGVDDLPWWQYAGDHPSKLPKGLPWGIDGFGKGDTNVVLNGRLPATLQTLKRWMVTL